MGERRTTQTYIPSNFDPSQAGRRSKPQHGQHDCRFMLPMSIKCNQCGDYMFQGTKANSRKELVYQDFYLGIPVYRFYIHCKSCYSEITIKTDPQTTDYVIEHGAERCFDPYHKIQQEQAELLKAKIEGSSIQDLEQKTIDQTRKEKQMEELEKIIRKKHKKHRIKLKDLKRIHEQEQINPLTPEQYQMVASFTPINAEKKPKKLKLKTIQKFEGNRWSNNLSNDAINLPQIQHEKETEFSVNFPEERKEKVETIKESQEKKHSLLPYDEESD